MTGTDYGAIVADWPPLSAEQRNELAVLLRMPKPRPPIDGKPHPKPPGPPRPLPPKPKGK